MTKKEKTRWLELKRNGPKDSHEAQEYGQLEIKNRLEAMNRDSRSRSKMNTEKSVQDLVMTLEEKREAEESKNLFLNIFEKRWKETSGWAMTAANMNRAADILFSAYESSRALDGEPIECENMQMDVPATLLYGYAMENLIKGWLIKFQNVNQTNYNQVNGWKNHNLVVLYGRIAPTTSEDEKLLLSILTAHVIWAGKYPTAFEFVTGSYGGFVLAEQYDRATESMAKNMPPKRLDRCMRGLLDSLFSRLMTDLRN